MSEPELDAAAARARLSQSIVPISELEQCPTGSALRRVLGADVLATLDLPPFDNAAMDGYAVRSIDCTGPSSLRVAGRALAGHPSAVQVKSGEAVRIMTGAALPVGADAVVAQEDVQVRGDRVDILCGVPAATHVRPRGQHLHSGALVLARGRRLRDYDLGLAAAAGSAELTLMRKLRVGVLSTGDELHDAPSGRGPGGQYDGNRPMLLAALESAGYRAIDLGIVADHADALAEALSGAAQKQVDIVVSSGGVAQGDADIVRRFPGLEFVPLAIRPGRGVAFGRLTVGGRSLFLFGLPGNSVAAYVMYQIIVAPMLALLAGTELEPPLALQLPLAVDASTRPGRIDWRRGRFVHRYGGLAVEPMAQQASFMLRTLSEADVLIAIGPQAEAQAGDPVEVIPLAALA
jgi:molybdopterin molybdotransferase